MRNVGVASGGAALSLSHLTMVNSYGRVSSQHVDINTCIPFSDLEFIQPFTHSLLATQCVSYVITQLTFLFQQMGSLMRL